MNVIWSKSPETHLDQLIKAQKKILRTIMYWNRYYYTNNYLYILDIFKISDIKVYFPVYLCKKSLNNLSHPLKYFSIISDNQPYHLRASNNLKPLYMSSQSQSSLSYYCCMLWNNLSVEIRNKPSIQSFKYALKQYLINSYDI